MAHNIIVGPHLNRGVHFLDMSRRCCTPKGRSCRHLSWKVLRTIAAFLVASSASAQLASDQIPHERTLPVHEQIRKELDASRVRIGVLRLQPTFAVRDLGYDNNVFGTSQDPVADWHSTASAGTRFIVPMGSKLYARGAAIPEYTYYQKLTNLRSFGGAYDAALLGLFNHMTVEAAASLFKGLGPVNSEVDRAALGRRIDATGKIELDVFGHVSVFGQAETQRQRYFDTSDEIARGVSVKTLERNEGVNRAGVRYRLSRSLDVSVAAEQTRTEFLANTSRDNKTRAVIVAARYDRPRTFLNLSIGTRTGEARFLGSAFPKYSTTTGSYYASHTLTAGLAVDAYGHRGIGYSLTVENPYFLETSNGAGIILPLGRRFAVRVFGETGTNDYPLPVASIKRRDRVTTYGGGLATHLYRNVVLTAVASQTKATSNLPGHDRSIFRVSTLIGIREGFF
jgi:hypothetical protein